MKKFFGILISCLILSSCNNFLTDNLDYAKKMSQEVRYNTAAQILVSVLSESGTVVTGSNRDARVGIPFEIELNLPKNVGVFEKWYAVVRDKNGNDTPLSSSDIVFDNENELKTNVTLLKEIKGVYVIAKVHANPVLSISYDNSDYYSSNSTREAKGLIVNDKKVRENEVPAFEEFKIITLNDYGISFERISFITSDGVTETKVPVYTPDQFNALGENAPEPYTYILNCEGANPGTEETADGTYYSSAVTNALLCLFEVSGDDATAISEKVSFKACLFHGLENMLYIRPEAVVYPKVTGNVEGYDKTTISPNTQKVVLPSRDVPFKISIPDEYTYESLSFVTDSGKVPEVYVTESDYLDESLEEVKSASLAVYSLNVNRSSSSSYETKTTVSFNVKAINGFSETINIKPVLRKNPVLVPSSKKNENTIEPALSEVRFHPGKDYDFTVASVSGYNFKDLIFTDEAGSRIYTFNQAKYDSSENKPEKYIFITDSKILDESLDSVRNALYAVYNFNPVLDDDSGEVSASFKIRAIKGYDEKLKVQADTYLKNSVVTPSGRIIAHPGKEYSVKFSSDNSYTFDRIKISTSEAFIPFYTEEEYNQTKPAAGTYAFYSENTNVSTNIEAVKNSLIAVYNLSVSVNEGRNYETLTNASLNFRLINETGSSITILPERIEKNTLALYADNTEGTLSPSSGTEIKMHPGKDYGVNIKSASTVSFSAIKATSSGKNIPVISDIQYSTMAEKPEPKTYIYLTEDAKLDTDSSAVTNSILAVYNFNVSPVEKTSNETYTQGNFIVRSMNVVSSSVTIEPVFNSKVVVNLAADSGDISPSSVLSYPGKDYSVTYESDNNSSFTNLIFFDGSNRLESFTETEYELAQPKPENYIAFCESSSLDASKEYIKNSIVAVYNMNISTEEKKDNEVITKCSFIFRNMNPYSGSVIIKPNLSPKTSLNFAVPEGGNISPAGVVKMFPGKDYSVSLQTTNDYSFDTLKFKSDSTVYPVYTSDEYSNAAVKPENYVFLSENAVLDTTDPAYKNSVFAVYNFNKLVTVTGENKSVTQGSFVIRVVKGTVENVTVSPLSILKKDVLFTSDTNSSVTPSGEVKTLSENGVAFSITSSDQYAVSALLVKDASGNIVGKYETAGKTSVPDSVSIYNSSDKKIVQIEDFKLEKNLSKLSGILYVDSSVNESVTITAETKVRPTVQSTDPYSYEKGVMRTSPITIRFSKPMKSLGSDSSAYLNYFHVIRCDNAGVLNENGENVFQEILSGTDAHPRYFKNPELKENNYQVVISPVSNTDESLWMKSGSEVRVSIDKTFTDEAGIPLLEDYYFTYTIGTKGDSTGPILSQEDTKLFLKGDSETPDEEIPVTIWGDFEPSDSPDPNHTYADSIHVVKDQMFKFKVSASDRDSKIKNFIAVLRLLYVPEGGNIPNAKQKAPKNLRLFDEKGNWLYEAGYLEKDFYKEIVVPYSGNDNIAISDDNLCTFDLNSFFTSDTIPLPVDGFFQIELTACDELYNRADNSVFYYFVRDTTAPRIIDNQHNISFTDDCGISYNNKRYFGKNKNSVAFRVNNETLYDFGVQEKPKIAGASDKVFWRVALATSKTVFDSTTMVSSWTSWKEASSIQKTLIPNSYFTSHPEDSIIYPWISLKDENGLIRTGFCDNGQLLYIDVTSPKVPVLIDNSDEYFMNLNKDILTLNKTSVTTNWRLEDQSSIGIETYPKLVVKENSQIIEPAGYSLTVNTGKSYEIYAEDLLGNISEKIVFNALFDTTPPHVEITGLNPEYNNSFSGLRYTGDPFNQDITYEDFSFTVGVGDGFDYDLKQQSSGSSSNGRTTTYTNGKVVLDFTVTETGHGIVENGIKITNIKISSIQIDDGPEVPYDDLKIFYNEIDRYYGPYTCIPVTDGTINNNTKYRVKGELIPRKDDSDNIADGDYFVEVYVSDGLNDESSDIDSIILDTTPPELCLGNSNDTQSWYSSTDVSKMLYFKQNNGEAIYNEIQSLIAFPNAVSNKNDLSSTYKAEDNGVRKAFIEIYVDSEYRYDSNNYIYYKKNNRYMYFDPKNDSTYTSINNIFPDNIISDNWTSHSVYLPSFSSEKSNSFIVKVSDIFGNSRNYYLNFYDDSEGPHLSFVSEKHTGLIKHYRNDNGVAVELESYPPEYIFKSVSFYTEDGKHSFYTEDLENAFLKDYSIDSTGTVWHYVALDKVGNSYSDKITVVLDNIPPEITLKSFEGTQSSSTTQNEFLLKLDLKDSISGLKHLNLLSRHKSVRYSLDGTSYEDIDYDYSEGIYKISFDEGYLKFPKTKSVWLKVITSGKFPEFHISIDDAIGNTSVFYVEDKNAPKLVSISNNNGSFVNYNLTDQNIQRVGEFPESTMVYSKNGIIYVYGAPSTTSVNLRMKATDQSYSSLTDLFDNPNNSFKFVITNDGTYNLSANTIMTKSVSTTKTGGESYFFKLRDCYNIESNQVSIKSYKVEVTNDTTYPWVNYSTERNKGNYSLSAGNLGIHTSSSSITYKTTATSISFDCNVISESNYDKLELIVDGLTKTTISGNTSGWTTRKVTGLSNGIHTFTWKFSKDGSTTADNEKCLIDNIIFE